MANAQFSDEGNVMNAQRLVASVIALVLAPPNAMAKSYKWNCVYTQALPLKDWLMRNSI
jgi:hypothetical protein